MFFLRFVCRQAILKSMPAMSTLGGTPFTPGLRRAAATDLTIETPKFGVCNAAFSGTPSR